MRNILLFYTLLLISACNQNKTNTPIKTMADIYLDKIEELKQHRNSCDINDTTFIYDLKAGMTESEVYKILHHNMEEGKLNKLPGYDTFYANMSFLNLNDNCKCELYPQYYDNKLYKVILKVIPEGVGSHLSSESIWSYVKSTYAGKYGVKYYASTNQEDCLATFIFKNKYIDIQNNINNGVLIEYGEFYYSELEKNKVRKENNSKKTMDNI